MMSDSAKKQFNALKEQEEKLQFDAFSREDALNLGLLIVEKAKRYPDPIAVEITVNGLAIFRYFMEGALLDSEYWLSRKRNSVDLMSMSSLRFMYWLEMHGTDVAGRLLDPSGYAAGGGGFPIVVQGTGSIGSICVSGLPDHLDDHQLIVDALTEHLWD